MKKKQFELDSPAYYYEEPVFKIFRIHPNGARIEKADKTLSGQANQDGLHYCGPYLLANTLGWWLWPAIDLDVTMYPDGTPNCHVGRWGGHYRYQILNDYDHSDLENMRKFDPTSGIHEDHIDPQFEYNGKTTCSIDEPEKGVITIWTGCCFCMPKDWGVLVVPPINRGDIFYQGAPYTIASGVLEFDWLRYDIWTNIKVTRFKEKISFRRNQKEPIAQLIPIHRSAYETQWATQEKIMDASDEECKKIFERYNEYNFKKWKMSGEKDPFVYRKSRKSELLKNPPKKLF